MSNSPQLVLGTRNVKKGRELALLLDPLGIQLATLADFPQAVDVVEDGDTFAANAAKKAICQARHLNLWVLGEDSGLAVDALGGAPGIFSARYSGQNATDAENNEHLLSQLGRTPLEQRTAHYVCHMTLSDPDGRLRAETEAYCRGRIRFKPAGDAGFGYDPLFEIVEYHRTFGQLGSTAKSCLSHRAKAMYRIAPQFARLVASGEWT